MAAKPNISEEHLLHLEQYPIDASTYHLKKSMENTKLQSQHAYVDLEQASAAVKYAFESLRELIESEEGTMLLHLLAVRTHVRETAEAMMAGQMIALAKLEKLKTCEVKLAEKNSLYDILTKGIPGFAWKSEIVTNDDTGFLGQIHFTETELAPVKITNEDISTVMAPTVKEVGKMRLYVSDNIGVAGMVVFRNSLFVVNHSGLIVYCYDVMFESDYHHGSLSHIYEGGNGTQDIQGMCLMMYQDTPMLVVSDYGNKALIWIRLGDVTPPTHRTQYVSYNPCGLDSIRGDLMVCDHLGHKVYRYACDGQPLTVVTLPWDVMPLRVARSGDDLIVTDWDNHKVVTTKNGQTVTELNGKNIGRPYDAITDLNGRTLLTDPVGNQVLIVSDRNGDEVRQLISNIRNPMSLCLNADNTILYVSARNDKDKLYVFVYEYNAFPDSITQLHLTVKL